MQIVFLSWKGPGHPEAGGSELLVDRLARGCLDRGHDVALICSRPAGTAPYELVEAGGPYTQYLRAPFAFLRRFRRADLVIDVENGIPFFSPLWRRRPVACLVHHVHGEQWNWYFPRPVAAVGRVLESRLMPLVYRRCRFLAISPSTATALADLGIPDEQIELVSSGVDLPAAAGRDRSPPVFLALGRLSAHKRLDLLLRLWERVEPRTGGRLVIAGDGPERQRLEELAPGSVDILGQVSEEEKQRLLQAAHLLVHPALHEGWGIVVLEAAAAETPALGFDVPGVRDSIVDGETGLLARSEDEFVERWVELAADPRRREQLGEAARRRAASFAWETAVDRFLEAAA